MASNEKKENNTRLVYQIAEVAAMLGLSRNACYQAVQRGELPAIRIGKRLLVPKASLFMRIGVYTKPAFVVKHVKQLFTR